MKIPQLFHRGPWFVPCLISLIGLAGSPSSFAQEVPKELKDVGITEHLGAQIPIDELKFKDEAGKDVALSQYFRNGRPVLMALVYYECPNLCNFVLNGVVKTLKELDWVPGKQFDIVAVSIDPKEKTDISGPKKAAYVKSYGKPETANGWHFLTGEESQIRRLADVVGFAYKWDGTQFAHGAAIYVVTPEGQMSRYFYGIEYPVAPLRMSLLEASHGKIGSLADQVVLFCYHYDPQTGKYSLYITRVMQIGCTATVLILGGYMLVFWALDRRKRRSREILAS